MSVNPRFQPLSTLTEYILDTRNNSVRDILRADDWGLPFGGLDLNPPYQRASVWTQEQRQNLIKSSLQGLPLGAVFINDRGDFVKRVVDGKQRLETFQMWFAGELAVPMEWFNTDNYGHSEPIIGEHYQNDPICTWESLTRRGQMFFNNSAMIAGHWTLLKTVEEEADLYERINYGGTPHEAR